MLVHVNMSIFYGESGLVIGVVCCTVQSFDDFYEMSYNLMKNKKIKKH